MQAQAHCCVFICLQSTFLGCSTKLETLQTEAFCHSVQQKDLSKTRHHYFRYLKIIILYDKGLNISHLCFILPLIGVWDEGTVLTGEEQPGKCILKYHLHIEVLYQGTVTLSSRASGAFIYIDKSEIKFRKSIHITGRRILLWKAMWNESLWPSEQSTKPHGPLLESSRSEKVGISAPCRQGCGVMGSPTHSFPFNTLISARIWV